MKPIDNHISIEQQLINLMLNHLSAIDEMLDDYIDPEYFDEQHRSLIDAIYQEYLTSDRKRLLTRETYLEFQKSQGIEDAIALINCDLYDECYFKKVSLDNLGTLKSQFLDLSVGRRMQEILHSFQKDVERYRSYREPALRLFENMKPIATSSQANKTVFTDLSGVKDEYLERLMEERNSEEKIITCGIPEIDDPINVGFRPMHLTLFVADVGGHKTNIMLNIALNVCEKHPILFVPLEMTRFDLTNRIIANRVNIPFDRIAKPSLLSDKEIQEIKDANLWLQNQYKFCILDAEERTSVSSLKLEIEKRVRTFKPKLVLIDYIANLRPDVRHLNRNDLEIGEILKDLRFLGKKHGFHIVSAAQMGRAAIKALKEGKDVDSTAIRGSHEYSADADTIFALLRIPNEDNRIKINTIKARHGRSGHTNELSVDPSRCLISSTSGMIELKLPSNLEEELDIPSSEIAEATAPKIEFEMDLDSLDDADDDDLSSLGI